MFGLIYPFVEKFTLLQNIGWNTKHLDTKKDLLLYILPMKTIYYEKLYLHIALF